MRPFPSLQLVALLGGLAAATRSSKRGLVYVPDEKWPTDYKVWLENGSDLTWYYNYEPEPSPEFRHVPQDQLEFVPMLWGRTEGTKFLDSVVRLIDGGLNVSHVLGFNEPDAAQYGGSGIDPRSAAQMWVDNIEPLAARGIKLGLPACTGAPGGLPWLQNFLGNCSDIVSEGGPKRNCTYDFVNIHWYSNFESLASHMGSYAAAFPNVTQWITEYNLAHEDLKPTQEFYNMSSEYFDRLDSVGRYSLFGGFRSKVSNVGPNAVMLSNDGRLTDIGSWYLGGSATGVDPQSAAGRSAAPVALAVAACLGAAGFLL